VEALTAMGFEGGAVRAALERFGGDTEQAADWLISERSQSGAAEGAGNTGGSSAAATPRSAASPASPMTPPTPTTGQRRVRLLVESCGGIKDGSKLANVNFAVGLYMFNPVRP
jgi:hypothetical protein